MIGTIYCVCLIVTIHLYLLDQNKIQYSFDARTFLRYYPKFGSIAVEHMKYCLRCTIKTFRKWWRIPFKDFFNRVLSIVFLPIVLLLQSKRGLWFQDILTMVKRFHQFNNPKRMKWGTLMEYFCVHIMAYITATDILTMVRSVLVFIILELAKPHETVRVCGLIYLNVAYRVLSVTSPRNRYWPCFLLRYMYEFL